MNIDDGFIRSLNLTSVADIRAILDHLDIQPSKSLGQNFLTDANILAIIIAAAGLSTRDQVLEVGTGFGALTEALAANCARVVSIEKDRRMADFLKRRFQPLANIELITADAMKFDLQTILSSGITKMVANLPYSVGSAVLVEIFKGDCLPERIVVTLQTEVGRRLAADPNEEDYGLLSIWSRLNYKAEICRTISPNCFYPRPSVQSAIVRLMRTDNNNVAPVDRGFFFNLTKYAFGQRRKQLQKILSCAPTQFRRSAPELRIIFQTMGIDPRSRPETLSVSQWIQLSDLLALHRTDISR